MKFGSITGFYKGRIELMNKVSWDEYNSMVNSAIDSGYPYASGILIAELESIAKNLTHQNKKIEETLVKEDKDKLEIRLESVKSWNKDTIEGIERAIKKADEAVKKLSVDI